MKTRVLFLAVAFAVSAANVIGQKRPKPTPTPVPGAQVETGAARTTPTNATADTGGSQVNKTNGAGKLTSGTGKGAKVDPTAGRISKLRITVVTGSDDLRSNSELHAFLILQDGRRYESKALNCTNGDISQCQGIPDGTRRTFEWELVDESLNQIAKGSQPPPSKPSITVFPADIRRFGLALRSHINVLQTGDNWNLNNLEVEYIVINGGMTSPAGTFTMYKNSGYPLYRFKTYEEWDTGPISLPH